MTKEGILDILKQTVIQDSLDKDIRNYTLGRFEGECHYEFLPDIYDENA